MQTILGANGIIGEELAKELCTNYTQEIRLVGRNPKKVNPTDSIFKADLMDAEATKAAVKGSEIVYLTVGLPYSSQVYLNRWPAIMRNTIDACIQHNCKLVYFDNTYMYDQSTPIQTEATPFESTGKKGIAKGQAARLLLDEIQKNTITAVICRAPEFYGPGKTKGITNSLVFENIKKGKKLKVLISDKKKRTLIYTPDASKATALIGNTDDAYGQIWHLPCDDNRLTYQEFIALASELYGQPLSYSVLKKWILYIVSHFNDTMKETYELLPRYAIDNIFDSSKFKKRFPKFRVTTYKEGIASILTEIKN